MSEEPDRRWVDLWYSGMSHLASICADALAEDDVEFAKKYAARWSKARDRFWKAWINYEIEKKKQSGELIPPSSRYKRREKDE